MAIEAGETTYYQAKRGIVQDGLVLNLDAAVDASYNGGTTWRDLAGSNNGTLTNGPTFSSENGGSIVFDGTDDRVTLSCAPIKYENWQKISFTIVFKQTGGNSRRYLFDGRNSGGISGAWGMFIDNVGTSNELTIFYNTVSSSWEEPTIYSGFSNNEWIIYTFTIDKSTSTNNVNHYINGQNVHSRSVTINSTTTDSSNTVHIGDYSPTGGGGYNFDGLIPIIYANTGIVFNENQVKQNYNAIRHRFGV